MNIEQYQAMLRAVEKALEVCDESPGFMEQAHRDICSDLRVARERLLHLIRGSSGTKPA
jgi:hypothetical protein